MYVVGNFHLSRYLPSSWFEERPSKDSSLNGGDSPLRKVEAFATKPQQDSKSSPNDSLKSAQRKTILVIVGLVCAGLLIALGRSIFGGNQLSKAEFGGSQLSKADIDSLTLSFKKKPLAKWENFELQNLATDLNRLNLGRKDLLERALQSGNIVFLNSLLKTFTEENLLSEANVERLLKNTANVRAIWSNIERINLNPLLSLNQNHLNMIFRNSEKGILKEIDLAVPLTDRLVDYFRKPYYYLIPMITFQVVKYLRDRCSS